VSSFKTFEEKQSKIQTLSSFEFFKRVGQVTGGTLLSITMLSSSVLAGGLVGLAISFRDLPDVRQLRNFVPLETTYIYDIKGAYATFANYGWQSPPTIIARVTDGSGNVLIDNTPKPQRVLDPWASAAILDVMQTVVKEGTGRGADIGRPVAGKTGTTSAEKDIWFIGTVPQLTTAIWVGRDNNRQLSSHATGGGMVAPIWRDFMQKALKEVPVENFQPPSNFPRPKSN
jgi:membrane peptidoglycan carboxypeptidase